MPTSLQQFQPELSRLAAANGNKPGEYLADILAAPIGVPTEIGQYRVYDDGTFYNLHDTALSKTGRANQVYLKNSTASYQLSDAGLRVGLTHKELEQPTLYGFASEGEMWAFHTRALTEKMRLSKEHAIYQHILNSANYASGFFTTPSTKWDQASSTPREDVLGMLEKLRTNDVSIAINFPTFMALQSNAQVLGAASIMGASYDGLRPVITTEFLKNFWGIRQEVYVSSIQYNSISDALTTTRADLWLDSSGYSNVFIGDLRTNVTQDLMNARFAIQLRLNLPGISGSDGWVVRTIENPDLGLMGGKDLFVGYAMQVKTYQQEAGALLTNVLT